MTLPVPAPSAPLADTYKHINDLRTAAVAAIANVNFVTLDNVTLAADGNGRFSYTVPGLTTLQGVVLQYRGTSTVSLIIRSISGKVFTGDIWLAETGSYNWDNYLWGPGNFSVYGFAWGVK